MPSSFSDTLLVSRRRLTQVSSWWWDVMKSRTQATNPEASPPYRPVHRPYRRSPEAQRERPSQQQIQSVHRPRLHETGCRWTAREQTNPAGKLQCRCDRGSTAKSQHGIRPPRPPAEARSSAPERPPVGWRRLSRKVVKGVKSGSRRTTVPSVIVLNFAVAGYMFCLAKFPVFSNLGTVMRILETQIH